MSRPTRETTAGLYLDLRKRARAEGRGTDELLVLYVLERFLYRVSITRYRDRLVLKGEVLLAVFDRRPGHARTRRDHLSGPGRRAVHPGPLPAGGGAGREAGHDDRSRRHDDPRS